MIPGPDHWVGEPDPTAMVPLWRRFCDELHTSVLREWTLGSRLGRVLKTDLFDEALGDGLVPFLMGRSETVHGLDVWPEVLTLSAKRHPGLVARIEDVRHLAAADGSYDFVVSNSTLDHFSSSDDLVMAVRELVRVLAPGGRLFITLDNPKNPAVAIRNGLPASVLNRTRLFPYAPGLTLEASALRALLMREGMAVVRDGYIMHAPRAIVLHACRLFTDRSVGGRVLLRVMHSLEVLGALPSAGVTGHFVAFLARKL